MPISKKNMPAAYSAVIAAAKQPKNAAALFFVWDTVNQIAHLGVGVTHTLAGEVAGYHSVTLSGKAIKINYYGSYDGSGAAHNAMETYGIENGLTIAPPAIELYITDPTTEPDTSKWLTEIYYLLQ